MGVVGEGNKTAVPVAFIRLLYEPPPPLIVSLLSYLSLKILPTAFVGHPRSGRKEPRYKVVRSWLGKQKIQPILKSAGIIGACACNVNLIKNPVSGVS